MKQHITLGEMKRDLSPSGDNMIASLLVWLDNHDYKHQDYITIGQIIEFLYEHKTPALIIAIPEKPNNNWCLSLPDSLPISKDHEPMYKDDLCDVLWEACKDVLNDTKE